MIIDTGSNQTLVSKALCSDVDLPEVKNGLCDVTGGRSTLFGPVQVTLQVGPVITSHSVYVADELLDPCILGMDFLQAHDATIEVGKPLMTLDGVTVPLTFGDSIDAQSFGVKVRRAVRIPPGREMFVSCKSNGIPLRQHVMVEASPTLKQGLAINRCVVNGTSIFPVSVANFTNRHIRVKSGEMIAECQPVEIVERPVSRRMKAQDFQQENLPQHLEEMFVRSCAHLSEEQTQEVKNLLLEYEDIFSSGDHDLGNTDIAVHHIDTGDHQPIKTPPRRMPLHKREVAEKLVSDMAQQGLIEKSFSPWSSALVLVRKKDNSMRCCVDYRSLNSITKKDSYPIPRIDDTLDALIGAKWFSTLDLKSGYHQVEVAEEDRPKTAFTSGSKLWQFRVMPFGLCNAPATFQRLMEIVLADLHWKILLVYLDDVIVYADSFQREAERLKQVFDRFRSSRLKLNPKKCFLFQQKVEYLGHQISEKGVETSPEKVTAVADWPTPSNKKQLRSFLGFCAYYRRFVKNFASIAAPLHSISAEQNEFVWSQECAKAFSELKQALTSTSVLSYPDPTRPFIVDADASNCGIGSVLSQEVDGVERVVAYHSRTLSKQERNYCVTRRELLAVVDAVKHFHHYLYGAPFMIRTDHSALRWLKSLKDPEGQMARWLARLEQYNYDIQYRQGERHMNADGLSRRPCSNECKQCGITSEKRRCRVARSTNIAPKKDHQYATLADGHQDESDLEKISVPALLERDADLKPILCGLREGRKPTWEEIETFSPDTKHYWEQWDLLRLRNGMLERRWETADGRTRWLMIVPRKMRAAVLKESHDAVTAGHFGMKKTLQSLRQRFYWTGMRRDAEEWCRTCSVCCAKKGPKSRPRAPLQVRLVGEPMARVAVDIAGPLPLTSSGNRYILVAMDYFTKWPEAYPIPNQEAVTVARTLVDGFFTRFGMPLELHSDQGRNFESAVFKETCKLLGIRKTRTTPLHPESDGMVEKFNWTLGQELAKFCGNNPDEWDLSLPMLIMAYRAAEHETTGYTPASLMLGRDLRMPVDISLGRPPVDENDGMSTTYAMNLRQRLQDVHQIVRNRLHLAAGTMKKRYDSKTSQELLSPGDEVWLYNPVRKKGVCPKLTSDWEGPYRVLDRLSDVTYRIQKDQGKKKIVHFNRLWKIKPTTTLIREKSLERREQEAVRGARKGPLTAMSSNDAQERSRPARNRRPPDRYGVATHLPEGR